MGKSKDLSGDFIVRFSLHRQLEHHINAIIFIFLCVTGLAQRFHDAWWADWVIRTLGGIDSTRVLHRYAGVLFAVVILQHIAVAVYGLLYRGWKPTIVISGDDFRHALINLRYYFGLTDEPARCHRYDYKQKFEYWGVILGGILMVATGLILWFPVQFFTFFSFLPGQLVPAAKVAHSNEAMLALLIIVVWHIYNAVFSPEVFPLDTSIFTGKISRERMLHEHPLELLELTGELPGEEAADPGLTDPETANS